MAQDDNIRFALSVIDDHRRLITAGKTHRWDIVKWAVTVNVALAAASIALKQQHVSAEGVLCLLAIVVVTLSLLLMWEITRRMTATRNDSLAPEEYLSEHGVAVREITKVEPPKKYGLCYDKRELLTYVVILVASVLPAALLWLFRAYA